MVPPIEQLRDDLLTRAAILGENPIAIRNHFTNIIESIQSIVRTYDLVNILENLPMEDVLTVV